jgi:hypothetical protein
MKNCGYPFNELADIYTRPCKWQCSEGYTPLPGNVPILTPYPNHKTFADMDP